MSTTLPGHSSTHPATPADWPPALALLLGPDAVSVLTTALDGAGGRLLAWRPRQVTHQPRRSTVVQYGADVEWADGRTTTETMVAATGGRIPEGATVLDDGTTQVALWRWPWDPSLPGLARALDRNRVARLLDDVGVGGHAGQLRVRAYRPGRRAVVEAAGGRGRLFLKVVRPSTVEALHNMHRDLAARLPVPDSVGWTDDGILVLPGLRGRTLRDVLRSSKDAPPDPADIESLLDGLPAELATHTPRRDIFATAMHHGDVLRETVPSLRPAIDDLMAILDLAPRSEHPVVPVHGDLYEAQLLVERGRLTGLLDVDTAGAGHRIDDLANLIAHLDVLSLVTDRPRAVARYRDRVIAHSLPRFGTGDLRARVAAAVIGLATGPFRVLEPNWVEATARRLDLARAWLSSATPGTVWR
jgi:hypothetical protein